MKQRVYIGVIILVVLAATLWIAYALRYPLAKLGKDSRCSPTLAVQAVNRTRELLGQTTGDQLNLKALQKFATNPAGGQPDYSCTK